MATHADRLQLAWTRLSEHLARHPQCSRSYRDQHEMACGEGQELLREYRYELGVRHQVEAARPVSTDEVIDVHERLEHLETLDELLHGEP